MASTVSISLVSYIIDIPASRRPAITSGDFFGGEGDIYCLFENSHCSKDPANYAVWNIAFIGDLASLNTYIQLTGEYIADGILRCHGVNSTKQWVKRCDEIVQRSEILTADVCAQYGFNAYSYPLATLERITDRSYSVESFDKCKIYRQYGEDRIARPIASEEDVVEMIAISLNATASFTSTPKFPCSPWKMSRSEWCQLLESHRAA